MRTLVSIVIPCFNQQETLARAIESVVEQTYQDFECIIVDDGSPVPVQIPKQLGDQFQVIRVTNRGLPSARNTGLMNCKGSGFLPLDADDWIEPEYLEKTVPLLRKGADVVFTGLKEHGPVRKGEYLPGFDRPHDQVNEETLWMYNRFFYCSLMRTTTLRSVGGYNSRMAGWGGIAGGYEDWDLWIDLMRRGVKFSAVNEHLFNYNTTGSMLVAAERNRDILVSEMRRHHGR